MMLGAAGISGNDSVVITGECLPCGGGPSLAIFRYWVLKSLGHDKVRLLDGGFKDWEDAGLNASEKPGFRQKTNYTPELRPELLAAFDFVVNGGAQVVDARSPESFEISSIPNAINIPYENILENDRIRNETELGKIFSNLTEEKPVVVYTNVGFEASIVWLALELKDYDARLYTLRDWLENQPEFILITIYSSGNVTIQFFKPFIIMTMIKSEAEAKEALEELKNTINEAIVKGVTPVPRMKVKVDHMEIYEYLPKTDCKICGEQSCYSFAIRLGSRETTLDECTPLLETKYTTNIEQLRA